MTFFIVYLILTVELAFVAWGDIKTKKIRNNWSILNIALYLLFLYLMPELYSFNIAHLYLPAFFLFFGFLLFATRIMGAGDVKFLTTFFLLIPDKYSEAVIMGLIAGTILIGTILLVANTFKNRNQIVYAFKMKDVSMFRAMYGTKFSFAPVILLAWLYMGVEVKIWNF